MTALQSLCKWFLMHITFVVILYSWFALTLLLQEVFNSPLNYTFDVYTDSSYFTSSKAYPNENENTIPASFSCQYYWIAFCCICYISKSLLIHSSQTAVWKTLLTSLMWLWIGSSLICQFLLCYVSGFSFFQHLHAVPETNHL